MHSVINLPPQPEAQDKIFPCHGAVDFVLCVDEGIKCLLFRIVDLLYKPDLTVGGAFHQMPQF